MVRKQSLGTSKGSLLITPSKTTATPSSSQPIARITSSSPSPSSSSLTKRHQSTRRSGSSKPSSRSQHDHEEQQKHLHCQQQLSLLQVENKDLKKRLEELRRSARSTTIVKKATTQAVSVKLPSISGAKNSELDRLRDELKAERLRGQELEVTVADLEEMMKVVRADGKAELLHQHNKAKEMSADINRLTAELRQLQEEKKLLGKDNKDPSAVQCCSQCSAKDDIIRTLHADANKVRQEMGAITTIARANVEQQRQQQDNKVELRKLRQTIRLLEADNDRLATQCMELPRKVETLATQESNNNNQGVVERMRKKLVEAEKREKTQKEDFENQRIQWQDMYKEWMKKAEAKITELQAVNKMIQMSLRQYKTGNAG
eukprot:m.3085 g.3085  ORF g.3085 m.3085 type:complete len:374 (+) comp2015_c0_seq1:34-1155(+)